jgi:hypothetical protein
VWEAPAYRWRKEETFHHNHSNEVEVTGSNPVQGLDSLYYYNDNNQPELPRHLDEQKQQQSNKLDWLSFKDYLLKHYNKNTTKARLCYAKRYYHVLLNEDASDLIAVESQHTRLNIMKSLTLLARFLGYYDSWQQLRKRHNLKWTAGNESITALQRFFNPDLALDVMIQKVREMINVLPPIMGEIVKFGVLVGLRPSEVVESVRLLQNSGASYYNPERQALEHFRFPEIFLRQTKKAYISFITLDNLQPIANLGCKTPGYNSIRLACQRRGIRCDMRYCRKVFASWLRKEGIQPEIVDLLQGRVSQSILTRHYLAPSQNMKDDVLKALEKLQRQL